ncbi:MAG: 2-amino-4-hydroxy-6-hydroxymethyldihydropteridine diphosphokinase [Peptococcaceae bacterium]|nr:2-amino-4-hydroxy-6-hydroxymethyldihydropteridine diphosphokinase [Peptococcaceae bacterium]
MDSVSIIDLEIFAHHGVFDFEKENGQTFFVSCDCALSTRAAGEADDLALALDYGSLAHRLTELFTAQSFDLIEAAAEFCARALLREFPLIRALDLTIKKPSAPVNLPLAYPQVRIHRGWQPAILALGSNIEPRQAHLDAALEALAAEPDIRVQKIAPWIETDPVGYEDQGPFINGAVQIETLLTPEALLDHIHAIEAAQGRQRLIHWGPRTLDIDIVYYADRLINTDTLTIPHPLCLTRDFVMQPLTTIAPHWIDPRYNQAVSVLWQGGE